VKTEAEQLLLPVPDNRIPGSDGGIHDGDFLLHLL